MAQLYTPTFGSLEDRASYGLGVSQPYPFLRLSGTDKRDKMWHWTSSFHPSEVLCLQLTTTILSNALELALRCWENPMLRSRHKAQSGYDMQCSVAISSLTSPIEYLHVGLSPSCCCCRLRWVSHDHKLPQGWPKRRHCGASRPICLITISLRSTVI